MKIRGSVRRGAVAFTMALGVALVGFAGGAEAFDELIPTKVGLVKFSGSPAVGKLYKLVSKAVNPPLFLLPTASPVGTGGTVAVAVGTGTLICKLAAQAYMVRRAGRS